MKDSKVNEVESVITPPPRVHGMAILPGTIVDQRLLVANNQIPSSRILSVNLLIPRTTILATTGSGPGQVSFPHGIAVDPNTRNIFVADSGNHRIQKFTPNFVFIKAWGFEGSVGNPIGIVIDSNFDVYVTDRGNHRVQKFDIDGNFIDTWGSKGTGDSQFDEPMGIAVESDDDIVVVDNDNCRIQKFKSEGQFIRSWGQRGTDAGEFIAPHGVAVDSNDDIYVADFGNQRVQKFDIDGNFIKAWGSPGTGDGQFMAPLEITFNRLTGSLLVSDDVNENIQIFTTDGVFSGKVNFGPILSDQ
jgi:DNA-binding beta-propeller fold protein YncE